MSEVDLSGKLRKSKDLDLNKDITIGISATMTMSRLDKINQGNTLYNDIREDIRDKIILDSTKSIRR